MRILFLSFIIQLVLIGTSCAQPDHVWMFGAQAGISFAGANPVAISSSINSAEAAASVCDAGGNLLFYTDGNVVWDRMHNPMPNGTGLQPFPNGTSSTAQGAQIVPVPDSAGKYYIFSLTGDRTYVQSNLGRLYYSVVDMTANGGAGDVISGRKGILMATDLCEQMTAVAGNDCDYWLLVCSQRDSLRAYHIGRSGISQPVRSPIAAGYQAYYSGLIGNIDVSDDVRRISIARGSLAVYDFDVSTGTCANMQILSGPSGVMFYDAAFSPDNNKLYATQGGGTIGLHQFDLATGVRTHLSSLSAYGIKRAPDNKLYLLGYNSNQVHAVLLPDVTGAGCQFTANRMTLATGALGRSKFSSRTPVITVFTDTVYTRREVIPECTAVSYPGLEAGDTTGTGYVWSDGTTGRTLAIKDSGFYEVRYKKGCTLFIDSFHVIPLFRERIDLGPDTVICDPSYTLDATYPGATGYLWSNGHRDARLTLLATGSYRVSVTGFRCPLQDTVYVRFVPPVDVDLGEDTIICRQTPARIGTGMQVTGSWRWSTGETTPYIEVRESGSYILSLLVSGCEFSDTILVTAMDAPVIDLGAGGHICREERILLDAFSGAAASYRWSNGDTQSAILVTEAGIYSVRVTSVHGCESRDTVRFTFLPDPVVYAGHDTVVCEESPLRLYANTASADSVIWSDGTAGPELYLRTAAVLVATAYNACGTASDTIRVRQIFCDIWLPNAFTPDGDGKNDVFRILGNTGRLAGFGLSVFNRWGERIFHTREKHQGWDGYDKGLPAQIGTYVYMLVYQIDGTPYQQSGNFHLLR